MKLSVPSTLLPLQSWWPTYLSPALRKGLASSALHFLIRTACKTGEQSLGPLRTKAAPQLGLHRPESLSSSSSWV